MQGGSYLLSFRTPSSQMIINMNVLSVTDGKVIIEENDTDNGGTFHCATVDLIRDDDEGELTSAPITPTPIIIPTDTLAGIPTAAPMALTQRKALSPTVLIRTAFE
ncbi:hypothetical protein HOY82DRAFT_617971 [Tuber indicum]|nr:hypothetical protein HOY82DRAFT_617971 [Tuber indicum]